MFVERACVCVCGGGDVCDAASRQRGCLANSAACSIARGQSQHSEEEGEQEGGSPVLSGECRLATKGMPSRPAPADERKAAGRGGSMSGMQQAGAAT